MAFKVKWLVAVNWLASANRQARVIHIQHPLETLQFVRISSILVWDFKVGLALKCVTAPSLLFVAVIPSWRVVDHRISMTLDVFRSLRTLKGEFFNSLGTRFLMTMGEGRCWHRANFHLSVEMPAYWMTCEAVRGLGFFWVGTLSTECNQLKAPWRLSQPGMRLYRGCLQHLLLGAFDTDSMNHYCQAPLINLWLNSSKWGIWPLVIELKWFWYIAVSCWGRNGWSGIDSTFVR